MFVLILNGKIGKQGKANEKICGVIKSVKGLEFAARENLERTSYSASMPPGLASRGTSEMNKVSVTNIKLS